MGNWSVSPTPQAWTTNNLSGCEGNNLSNQTNFSITSLDSLRHVTIPIVIVALLMLGLLGNGLVIWITMTTERIIKHPIHSMLVLNLAVSDLIYLVASCPYQAITHTVPRWVFGSCLCRLLHFLNLQTMSVSILTMCSLAFLRFSGLLLPFRFRKSSLSMEQKRSGCIIVITMWISGSSLALPNLIYYNLRKEEHGQGSVILECVWADCKADAIYSILLLVVTFVIPFLLVSIFYIIIAKQVIYGLISREMNDRKESVRTTLMVFSLIIAFLVCWFPHHLYRMVMMSRSFSGSEHAWLRLLLEDFGNCFSYAHACVNPIIYTFAAPGFRRTLLCSVRKRTNFATLHSSRNREHARRNEVKDERVEASNSRATQPTVTHFNVYKTSSLAVRGLHSNET